MAKFKVDTEKVAQYVSQLEELRGTYSVCNKKPASDAAKGNTYEAVEEVSEKLLSAREAFLELVDRTIEFLDVSKASFDASDKAEAASVTKK